MPSVPPAVFVCDLKGCSVAVIHLQDFPQGSQEFWGGDMTLSGFADVSISRGGWGLAALVSCEVQSWWAGLRTRSEKWRLSNCIKHFHEQKVSYREPGGRNNWNCCYHDDLLGSQVLILQLEVHFFVGVVSICPIAQPLKTMPQQQLIWTSAISLFCPFHSHWLHFQGTVWNSNTERPESWDHGFQFSCVI